MHADHQGNFGLGGAPAPGHGNAMALAAWPSSLPRHVPPFADSMLPMGQPGELSQKRRARRDRALLSIGATAIWLLELQHKLSAAGASGLLDVPLYHVSRLSFTLKPRPAQAWPAIMVTLYGTVVDASYAGFPPREVGRSAPRPLSKSFEIAMENGHYRIVSDKLPPGGSRGS